MSPNGGCPGHEILVAYVFGRLAPERESAVSAHVETCAACEARIQQIEQQTDPLVDVQFISADQGWGTTRSGRSSRSSTARNIRHRCSSFS